LIDNYEPTARNYYGGAIGFMGFDGSCNHAIMIRTFLSMQNTLTYQAGAGVVAASKPESELQEVNNKLGALKKAIDLQRAFFIKCSMLIINAQFSIESQ
jgi:anthranilate synthase component 1